MSNNDLTYQIIGAAMHVHNELGSGLREKPYENALLIALRKLHMHVDQQRAYPIRYENHIVGDCFTDLVVNNELIIEAKAIDKIGDNEVAQTINYLRIAKIKLGLILNFKPAQLEVRRVSL